MVYEHDGEFRAGGTEVLRSQTEVIRCYRLAETICKPHTRSSTPPWNQIRRTRHCPEGTTAMKYGFFQPENQQWTLKHRSRNNSDMDQTPYGQP